MSVPCSPIETPDQPPCAGRPVAGLELDFTGSGTAVSTRTDSNGAYSVDLGAGTWKVSFNGSKGFQRIISGPTSVTVQAGASVVADYLVDSGIRVPVNSGSGIRVPVSKEPSQTPTHPGGVPAA
jgi:Carboxypeptidase regulatory-like domain